MQSNVFIGVKPSLNHTVGNLTNSNEYIKNDIFSGNYDYILLPITNSRYKETVKHYIKDFKDSQDKTFCSDLTIPEPQLQDISISPFNGGSQEEAPRYIGLLSSWLELESPDLLQRSLAFQVLLNECRYAKYVGIKKLILAPPKDLVNLQDYSQIVARLLNSDIFRPGQDATQQNTERMILSISLPLCEDSDPLATWEIWNTVRKLCDFHPSLTISLAISKVKTPNYVLNRWLCEPVSCLLVSSSIFATNKYGYPVLYKFNQNLIRKFQDINGNSQTTSNDLCVLLHGMEKYAYSVNGGENSYLAYINHLLKKGDQAMLSECINGSNEPYLLSPLKPNSENLTNEIYSNFEKDEVKYDMYEKAIEKAICNIKNFIDNSSQFTILIAGAGRGAIVDKLYQVIMKHNIINRARILALEKNPEACLYLQKRNFEYWNSRVELIKEDMKTWKDPTIKIDICISELLGSFGCNELSPECLFEIEKYHGKPNTIYIPKSYSSYVAPITCPLIYQKLKDTNDRKKNLQSFWVLHKIPYQVLSSKISKVWTFKHPMIRANFTQQYTTVFKLKQRGEIHGLIGFFTAILYDEETILSIIPDGHIVKDKLENYHMHNMENIFHTKDMISWSPIIFPLEQPLPIVDDTEVSLSISRLHNGREVWYEWSMESFMYFVVPEEKVRQINNHTSLSKDVSNNNHDHNIYIMPKTKYMGYRDMSTFEEVTNTKNPNPNLNLNLNPKSNLNSNSNSSLTLSKSKNANANTNTNISSNLEDSQQNSLLKNKNFVNLTTDNEEDEKAQDFALQNFNSGWQSVNDIHGWVTDDPILAQEHGTYIHKDINPTPTFNLSKNDSNNTHTSPPNHYLSSPPPHKPMIILPQQLDLEPINEEYISQEIHMRVKTGSTTIHNIGGHAFSIPI
ncbi:protein arginine N-methyltransferase PWA37_002061 [Arxiozyma heterogenica]|uniref:protein arginine N-methyltransferase n=1 Tax=Arxiozyma heterogenica TaxID=278026 RepID=UPI002EDD6991